MSGAVFTCQRAQRRSGTVSGCATPRRHRNPQTEAELQPRGERVGREPGDQLAEETLFFRFLCVNDCVYSKQPIQVKYLCSIYLNMYCGCISCMQKWMGAPWIHFIVNCYDSNQIFLHMYSTDFLVSICMLLLFASIPTIISILSTVVQIQLDSEIVILHYDIVMRCLCHQVSTGLDVLYTTDQLLAGRLLHPPLRLQLVVISIATVACI